MLYREVQFSVHDGPLTLSRDEPRYAHSFLYQPPSSYAIWGAPLMNMFGDSPHLRSLVRSVTLAFNNRASSAINLLRMALQTLLAMCPNLDSLKLVPTGTVRKDELERLLVGADLDLGRLRSVQALPAASWMSRLSQMPSLRYLSVQRCFDVDALPDLPIRLFSFQERKLELPPLLPLCNYPMRTLTFLKLDHKGFMDLTPHWSRFPKLHHLELDGQSGGIGVDALYDALPTCTSPKVFTLAVHEDYPRSELILALPRQLECIMFTSDWGGNGLTYKGLEVLLNRSAVPCLRCFEVGGRRWEEDAEVLKLLCEVNGWTVHKAPMMVTVVC